MRASRQRGGSEDKRSSASAVFERAMELHSLDHTEAALDAFIRAAEIDATHRDAMIKAGMLLRDEKRYEQALDWFGRAAILNEDAFVLNERGICRLAAGQSRGAMEDFARAVSLEPEHANAHCNLGVALQMLGRKEDALRALQRAVALDHDSFSARCSLASALRESDRHQEALAEARHAMEIEPETPEPRVLVGLILRELGQPQQAVECLRGFAGSPEALSNLALAEQDLGNFDESARCYERALEMRPDDNQARLGRGMLHLLRGEWRAGWEDYAARFATAETPYRDFGCPGWGGEPLNGKTLVVYAEQGLGDEIMFASCIPDLMKRVPSLVLDCDPRLGGLFARSFPGAAIIADHRARSPARVRAAHRPDFQVAAGDLPRLFRPASADFRNTGTPFLFPDAERVQTWRARLQRAGAPLRVGIAWRGGLNRTRRASRSIEPRQLLKVVATAGRSVVSLQHDASPDELELLAAHGVQHWPAAFADLDDLAALLCSLDVIVTVCQSLVHLSGALGRPTLVLTPTAPEWRYGTAGTGMPWYRSVMLLRQARSDSWDEPLREAAERLVAL